MANHQLAADRLIDHTALRGELSRRQFLTVAAAGAVAAGYSGTRTSALADPATDGQTPPRRPNFLFIVPDQHRHDWLGCAAAPVRTPNIDALAAQGTRFTRAVCAAPVCGPS